MTRIALVASALAVLAGCGDFDTSGRRERLDQVAANLAAAYESFDLHDFDGCIAYCQLMLATDPGYKVAQELAEDAAKMKERGRIDLLKRLHVREIADILLAAIDRFDLRDFDGCIACCQWILSREPGYWVAQELAEDAETAKGREHYSDLRLMVDHWKKSTSSGEMAAVPGMGTLTYPHLASTD
jgi:hypothetical protein